MAFLYLDHEWTVTERMRCASGPDLVRYQCKVCGDHAEGLGDESPRAVARHSWRDKCRRVQVVDEDLLKAREWIVEIRDKTDRGDPELLSLILKLLDELQEKRDNAE